MGTHLWSSEMRVKSTVYVKPFRTGSDWHIEGMPLWCKIPFKIQINLYIHKYRPAAYNTARGWGGVGVWGRFCVPRIKDSGV